ncbi:MAG: hypothetical protein RRY23_02620, partial [Alistipes sp.]
PLDRLEDRECFLSEISVNQSINKKWLDPFFWQILKKERTSQNLVLSAIRKPIPSSRIVV